MRRSVSYALIAVVVVLLGSTAFLFTKYQKASSDFVDMKSAEEQARDRYSHTIDAIAEIQDSLNAIPDSNVKMLSSDLQTEQQLSGPNGQQALDKIAVLRASIMRNKDRIRQLESSLSKSGMKVAGLQKMLANLKQSVAEKEQLVADLSTRVDSLQTQVAGLQTEVTSTQDTIRQRDETLEVKRREIATIYYVVGTKKDLTMAGVVKASGGVLGMGKTLQPAGGTASAVFTPLDTDQQTVIHTPAAKTEKVKVLSAQPPSSYQLAVVDGKVELHIIDPDAFRKIKELVILTA
jgi:uncharacterized coiled-coil protein SlyX